MELTKRTVLDVGRKCNSDCKFCYYKGLHNKDNLPIQKLKERLNKAKSYGIDSIEFTGGEPAFRSDIFELINYAKKLGFKRLAIITNGIMFSNITFVKKIKESGLEEVKFSIHGPNPKIHDKITGVNGSFKKLINGVKNAKKLGLKVNTSTVINQINYKHLVSISNLLITLNPSRVNFLLINPIINAQRLGKDIVAPYSKIEPYLHKAIDILTQNKVDIAIRYIPFCFMEGHEKYVRNLNQVQYDPDEWDYLIKNKIEYNKVIQILNLGLGLLNILKKRNMTNSNLLHNAIIQSKIFRLNTKDKQCKVCKYNLICDGLWKSYAKLYGYSELKPSPGEKITDPLFFITNSQ